MRQLIKFLELISIETVHSRFRKMVRIHKEGHKFLFVLFVIGFAINLVISLFDLSIWVKGFVLLFTVFELFFFLQFFRSPIIKKNPLPILKDLTGK